MNSVGRLRLFLDRSVGTGMIATALREAGIDVETIVDRYGMDQAPRVSDDRWIVDATAAGRLLLGADLRIRYRTIERIALCRSGGRYFAYPSGNLTGPQMIDRFLYHLAAVERVAVEPGPFVFHLTEHHLVRMRLDCADL
jgi:PIN like domain